MTNQDLAALRKSLDDIDAVLVSALGERARLARQIAQVKADGDGPVRDADRETALLQHRSAFGERLGLDPAFVRRIFREILDDSVRRQQDALQTSAADAAQEITVAFQGTEGAYGHQAALQHFAVAQRPVGFKAYGTFKEMLEAVIEGHVDRAMLPIENTTAGSVYESYDLLLRFNLAAGRRGDRRRSPLPARRGGCADRVAAPHSLASAGAVAVQRVPVDAARVRGRQRREHRAGGEARARSQQPARGGDRQRGGRRAFRTARAASATSPTSR